MSKTMNCRCSSSSWLMAGEIWTIVMTRFGNKALMSVLNHWIWISWLIKIWKSI